MVKCKFIDKNYKNRKKQIFKTTSRNYYLQNVIHQYLNLLLSLNFSHHFLELRNAHFNLRKITKTCLNNKIPH